MRKLPRDVRFFATSEGNEPVREWLKALPKEERKIIGEDIKTVQGLFQWHKPLVDSLACIYHSFCDKSSTSLGANQG